MTAAVAQFGTTWWRGAAGSRLRRPPRAGYSLRNSLDGWNWGEGLFVLFLQLSVALQRPDIDFNL